MNTEKSQRRETADDSEDYLDATLLRFAGEMPFTRREVQESLDLEEANAAASEKPGSNSSP
jgi:hypothetical protein